MLKTILIVGLTAIIANNPSVAVKITNLEVPSTYTVEDNDSTDSLVLDCQYEVGEKETGFVLKWFLNGIQIYQWIPNHMPFPLGPMKTSIDKTFSISENKTDKYRAISIINPSWNMTGDYKCSVQTFQSSDEETSHLQIIVPESKFEIDTTFDAEENDIDVECSAHDIFPKPQLSLKFNNEPLEGVQNAEEDENGLFDATISAEIPKDQIETPATITCNLIIPDTEYSKQTEEAVEDEDVEEVDPIGEAIPSSISRLEADIDSDENSASSYRPMSLVLAIIMIIFAIC